MSSFTPGPWEARAFNDHSLQIPVRDAAGEGVANVWGGNEEAHANARLIAAAPDLLERVKSSNVALEEAAKLLDGAGMAGCARIMRGYVDGNNAAIAKAKGGAA